MSRKPGKDENARRLAEAAGASMYARDRAAQVLGIALLAVRPGFARMRMTVRDDMVNGHDTCHGGLIFALADTAFAYACNSHNRNAVAQHCTITFVQPAQKGETLVAEAAEQSLDGRNGVYDTKVENERGELVALFRGASRVIPGDVARNVRAGKAKEPS